jgi:SprT protein
MPKEKAPLEELGIYLPEGSLDYVLNFIYQHKIQLTVTRKRKSILGNYQYHPLHKSHRISINGNLNPYSFLVTLLHEIAHLTAFEKFGANIQPHGKEWKNEFGILLKPMTEKKVFPEDVEQALKRSLQNAAAGTCGDPVLLKTLRKYDQEKNTMICVEELEMGSEFYTEDRRLFVRGDKIRTRYKCQEKATGKWYLFHGLYEVFSAVVRTKILI